MSRNTFRFIGGPKHGELITLRGSYFSVPVLEAQRAWAPTGDDFLRQPLHFREVRYERRPIVLGPGGRIDVLVPEEMRDAEMFRRLADFIEGTTPPERHGE